jgi:hypothetical protein
MGEGKFGIKQLISDSAITIDMQQNNIFIFGSFPA